jgi:hypothetical protein
VSVETVILGDELETLLEKKVRVKSKPNESKSVQVYIRSLESHTGNFTVVSEDVSANGSEAKRETEGLRLIGEEDTKVSNIIVGVVV